MCNIALYAKYTFRYRIYIEIQCHSSESKQVVEQLRVEVKSLKIAKYGLKQQIVWAKQKTIENKSLPLWNKAISMEDIRKDQFVEIVTMIQHTRNEVVRLANASLIDLYWRVGKYISDKISIFRVGRWCG